MHSSKFKLSTGRLALALVVAMALSFTGGLKAFAFDDGGLPSGSTGSITVHKYKTGSPSTTPGSGSELKPSDLPDDAQPLANIGFSLYPLDTAKVEGGGGVPAATSAPDSTGVDAFVQTYGQEGAQKTTGNTDSSGTLSFPNLSLGYYLLVEDTQNDEAHVDAAVPSIITVPYAQQATGGTTSYVKDVHVYPKNVSNLDVEKRFQGATPESVSPGDVLKYQISYRLDDQSLVFPVMGTVKDLVPVNNDGDPLLKIGNWKAFVYTKDGTPTDVTSMVQFASDQWTLGDAVSKVISDLNKGTDEKKAYKVQILFEATVTDASYYTVGDSDGETFVMNKSQITLRNQDQTTPYNNAEADAPAVPIAGFGFTKVDSSGNPITQSTASFKVAGNYDDANQKKFLHYTSSDGTDKVLTATTNVNDGKASLSGLSSGKLFNGDDPATPFTLVSTAITAAKNAPGTPQSVDLWVVETKAPDGFRILQAPQKITLIITKAADNGPLSFKIDKEPLKITNYKDGESGGGNFALPNTGGLGGILLIAAGVLVFALGMTAHARNRRRARQNNTQEQ